MKPKPQVHPQDAESCIGEEPIDIQAAVQAEAGVVGLAQVCPDQVLGGVRAQPCHCGRAVAPKRNSAAGDAYPVGSKASVRVGRHMR